MSFSYSAQPVGSPVLFHINSSAKRTLFSRSIDRSTPRKLSTLYRRTTLLLSPALHRTLPPLSRRATSPMHMTGSRPRPRLTRASNWGYCLCPRIMWALVSRFTRLFRCRITLVFSLSILRLSIGRVTQEHLCIMIMHRPHRHISSLCLNRRTLWRHPLKPPHRTSFHNSVPLIVAVSLC